MVADNPTVCRKKQECTDFKSLIPRAFDSTVPLDGNLGEFFVLAHRKNDTMYACIPNNWNARDVTMDFSFFEKGVMKLKFLKMGSMRTGTLRIIKRKSKK